MHWLKKALSRRDVVLTGMFLLLVLFWWIPVSAEACEVVSGLATPGTIMMQATPTVDATATALSKEKLAQEVQQLKQQNAPDLVGWLRSGQAMRRAL